MISLCGILLMASLTGIGSKNVSGKVEERLDMSGELKGTLVDVDGTTYIAELADNRLHIFFNDGREYFNCDWICVDKGRGKCDIIAVFEEPRGIYKQESNRITLCVSFDGKYPTSFSGGNDQWLLTLRRGKSNKK